MAHNHIESSYLGMTEKSFFALLRAGLWEQGVRISNYGPIDYESIYSLAEEQAVVGLVAAGLEHIEDAKVTKKEAIPFLKKVFALECRNDAMNSFIGELTEKLRGVGIFGVLVKGQGVAQCYSRPSWRSAGDIDFLFSVENHKKAKTFLSAQATSVDEENPRTLHLGMKLDGWNVELHGSMRNQISRKADSVIDEIQKDTVECGAVRAWRNGSIDIFLPSPDNDIVFVFTHILKHFFRGGVGLRQICDLCRLLWSYRDAIDRILLESRIRRMGFLSEWKAFAAYIVEYLGMPKEAMPMYDSASRWVRKAKRINEFILRVGNFGGNRDKSFYKKYPYLVYKAISLWRHLCDFFCHAFIFPLDAFRVFIWTLNTGVGVVAKGK